MIISKLGTNSITSADLELKVLANNRTKPGSTRTQALDELELSLQYAAILNSYGIKINESILQLESHRIFETSQRPAELNSVRKLFQKESDFLRLYVQPVLTQRLIYFELYSTSPSIHLESMQKANEILKQSIKAPQDFIKIANSNNNPLHRLTLKSNRIYLTDYPSNKNKNPLDEQPLPESAPPSEPQWLVDYRGKYSKQLIFPNIIELNDRYIVIKKTNLTAKNPEFLSISIKKIAFHDWLENEILKYKIEKIVPLNTVK